MLMAGAPRPRYFFLLSRREREGLPLLIAMYIDAVGMIY